MALTKVVCLKCRQEISEFTVWLLKYFIGGDNGNDYQFNLQYVRFLFVGVFYQSQH